MVYFLKTMENLIQLKNMAGTIHFIVILSVIKNVHYHGLL